ncbi:MAG: hypothetical protein BWY83_03262 [bacterium ADurb.Bin478]|nr:MAG: hypothetical protein BWY83_03262 [bacterium ADurb.Bin478]
MDIRQRQPFLYLKFPGLPKALHSPVQTSFAAVHMQTNSVPAQKVLALINAAGNSSGVVIMEQITVADQRPAGSQGGKNAHQVIGVRAVLSAAQPAVKQIQAGESMVVGKNAGVEHSAGAGPIVNADKPFVSVAQLLTADFELQRCGEKMVHHKIGLMKIQGVGAPIHGSARQGSVLTAKRAAVLHLQENLNARFRTNLHAETAAQQMIMIRFASGNERSILHFAATADLSAEGVDRRLRPCCGGERDGQPEAAECFLHSHQLISPDR